MVDDDFQCRCPRGTTSPTRPSPTRASARSCAAWGDALRKNRYVMLGGSYRTSGATNLRVLPARRRWLLPSWKLGEAGGICRRVLRIRCECGWVPQRSARSVTLDIALRLLLAGNRPCRACPRASRPGSNVTACHGRAAARRVEAVSARISVAPSRAAHWISSRATGFPRSASLSSRFHSTGGIRSQ